jgi:adenosylhomocysteine nucleosidase
MSSKVAIVAALEREVKPIVRRWQSAVREYEGRRFTFFANERAVLVCGGIGAEAARRATQAVIALYQPEGVISVGFAGALEPGLKVGDLFVPRTVVDSRDSGRTETGMGKGILVSFSSIATKEQKSKLAQSYGAQAVDMEAAAVAQGAQARGVRFLALKAVSDGSDFEMPQLDRFVREGQFCATEFVAWTAVRPWLWGKVICLAKNSAAATKSLCRWLDQYNHPAEILDNPQTGSHLIAKS